MLKSKPTSILNLKSRKTIYPSINSPSHVSIYQHILIAAADRLCPQLADPRKKGSPSVAFLVYHRRTSAIHRHMLHSVVDVQWIPGPRTTRHCHPESE